MDKIKIVYIIALMCFVLYNIPVVKERIGSVKDIFKLNGGKTSGSSIDLRTTQLQASYREFLSKPIYGHGLYYIEEDMGWANLEEERTSDSDFQGFESYIYQLLIEQGLVGILTTIIIVLSIAIYYIKKRRISKEVSALGLSILVMFLMFIIGTGTLHSWIISMGLIGLSIKYLELKCKEV
jgi:O-antigen ligase